MIYQNILDAVGHTPLLRLNRLKGRDCADIIVKFEGLNVGGSIKTRTALHMIEQAEKEGKLHKDSILVEPTSGNQGIGIALVGAVKGYQVKIILPDSVSEERRKLICQYGAEVIVIHDQGDIGACIKACQEKAEELQKADSRVFVPQQFSNPANPETHETFTAREILSDLEGVTLDGFVSGVGTGGTLSGIGKVLKRHFPKLTVWAVEPEHAAILSGGSIGTHLQMGIGDGLIPENLNRDIYGEVAVISDEEALETARRLAKEEGILCGISSGSNVAAALRLGKKLGKGKTVLTILPDTGERYFSTELFRKAV